MNQAQAFIVRVEKNFDAVVVVLKIVCAGQTIIQQYRYGSAEEISGENLRPLILREAARIESMYNRADEIEQMRNLDLIKLNRLLQEGVEYDDAVSQSYVDGGSN